ncbi:hypothetical protein S40285_01927 [Stachybotrys chlorohalonatus IBT 40285]|uniref:RED-like N-terminal domain-containing protein n=1 Tax=Stachybotrys chlorohalonatus (strain IBT 40285) TaxID=1283841 RepID=A0A084QQR7_STAC4|nr:hypothetical protein S40285_01927 [Stachybotrys chlorohalonata IBT 40285]
MNNEQFRRLLVANAASPEGGKSRESPSTATPRDGGALGSRQRSSIPMTPRQVGSVQADFARQLAARQQAAFPKKKFKTSAPKGSKFGSGYVDRAAVREQEASDDREQRLKALEEALKKEEIDQETYDRQRAQIAGGDLESTHLVKGLDFKLLERIRKGEDVYSDRSGGAAAASETVHDEVDDEEFERIEEQDVQAVKKERERKKGNLSTVSLAPGKKRTRDQILAELKASRQAAQQESALNSRFRKIGGKQEPGTRIERDSKGREVLIIIDEDGHEKRKVRKLPVGAEEEAKHVDLPMPDKNAKPLGMEVPEQYRKQEEPEEDDDVDIFDDVGHDYNPLAGLDDSGSDSEDDEKSTKEQGTEEAGEGGSAGASSASQAPAPKTTARNYFKDARTGLISEEAARAPAASDPAILAAIKRAAALKAAEEKRDGPGEEDADDEARALEARRKKLLQANDRDNYDIDMGFGTSRFEDEEDFEDKKVKLSKWGEEGDGQEGGSKGAGSKRKRGPKKRKGDGNNASDVLKVMEQRKKSSS